MSVCVCERTVLTTSTVRVFVQDCVPQRSRAKKWSHMTFMVNSVVLGTGDLLGYDCDPLCAGPSLGSLRVAQPTKSEE